ncbi:Senescence-specific cysteine protease SAG39 [Glycine soja]
MASIGKKQHILALVLLLPICISQVMSRNLHEASMHDAAEKQKRLLIFKDNVEFIESFNAAGNKPYKLSINHLTDQTNEEFVASHNGYKHKGSHSQTPFKYENITMLNRTHSFWDTFDDVFQSLHVKLSTLNSAPNVILDGNWVAVGHFQRLRQQKVSTK